MPDACHVLGDIRCPTCDKQMLEAVRCQWGIVPCHAHYRLGDAVRWMKDRDGLIVKSFTIREDDNGKLRWNCGGPEYSNVILLDVDLALRNTQITCPNCRTRIQEVIAVVHDGVFREVRALDEAAADRLLGTSAGKADIVIVREDGTFWPREDWFEGGPVYVDEDKVPAI